MSYGNAAIGLEVLVEMIGRFKSDVRADEIKYVHLTGLSSAMKRESNREFLIIAR